MRKEGTTAAAAAAAEEAAGVRGRADAAEEGDGAAVGRSGGRAELRKSGAVDQLQRGVRGGWD